MENIALDKPVISNLNNRGAHNINDGREDTFYESIFFPACLEIDLLETCDIHEIILEFMDGMAFYYTLYGSNDRKDYKRIYKNHSDIPKNGPDIIKLKHTEYRYIRIYIEYNDTDEKAYLKNVMIHGDRLGINNEKPETDFEKITGIKDFNDTAYSEEISEDEVYETVYGIIERTAGKKLRDWFDLELNGDINSFEIRCSDGKIHVTSGNGLGLCSGINYYFKHYLHIYIGENTKHVDADEIVIFNGVVSMKTPFEFRYAMNYCTECYTFAFASYDEWLHENDYLALNGVNLVLDTTGEEAVWIRFLMNYNYTYEEARNWLVGPAYRAWQYMDNMEVFGGPLNDRYIADRVESSRKIQRIRRALGMHTILQGYAGMVPVDFDEHNPDASVIPQGLWNGFNRPSMIETTGEAYDEMARDFYEAQRYIFGNNERYFAVDPFHEGGKRTENLSDETVSEEVLSSLLEYRKDAVWVIQAWWSNPTNELLKGMGKLKDDHALIIDLVSYPLESHLNYQKTQYYDTQLEDEEFNNTSWVWGLLANFGGNPSMNGEMDAMTRIINEAKKMRHFKGIGIISEAVYDNPMIYDLLFSMVYEGEINIDEWIKEYLLRRYGYIDDDIICAWNLIRKNNYSCGARMTDQAIDLRASGLPSNKHRNIILYNHNDLYEAFMMLMESYDLLKDNECYRHDLSEIARQVVSDFMSLKSNDMQKGLCSKEEFLHLFDLLNDVLKTDRLYLAGEWVQKAIKIASEYDDFTVDSFRMNAKSLITSWGSIDGSLVDYAFRTYEGELIDIYKENYIRFFNGEENFGDAKDYGRRYFKWALSDKEYQKEPISDYAEYKAIMHRVLDECVYDHVLNKDEGNLALGRKAIFQNNAYIIDLLGIYEIMRIECDEDIEISEDGISYRNVSDKEHVYTKARYLKMTSDVRVYVYGERALATVQDLGMLINTSKTDKIEREILDRAIEAVNNNEAIDTANAIYWKIAEKIA